MGGRIKRQPALTASCGNRPVPLGLRPAGAQHRFLMLIAEFDRAEGWSGAGIPSCAHWLNWKCGIDLGAAREKLRVAHALALLPRISSAMASGELSYSKVRALTRVATAQTEEDLLMMARHGPGITPETAVSRWVGEPLDLGLAVAGLMDRWERSRREGRAGATPDP